MYVSLTRARSGRLRFYQMQSKALLYSTVDMERDSCNTQKESPDFKGVFFSVIDIEACGKFEKYGWIVLHTKLPIFIIVWMNVFPSWSTAYVYLIVQLAPYFCEHVWSHSSRCFCYAIYQQQGETHKSPLSNSTWFDNYWWTAAELKCFEIGLSFLIQPVEVC